MTNNASVVVKPHLEYALKLLSYRPRSVAEISDRLKGKKLSTKEINAIINKLKKLKLVDDDEFVKWWQSQRDSFRPKSYKILSLELRKKGVSNEVISSNLDTSHEAELGRVKLAFKKKFKTISFANPKEKQKAIRYLASRGFSWDIIKITLTQT